MKIFFAVLTIMFPFFKASAVRPFITDDARVVGLRLAQLEAWLRYDKHAWQQWNMVAYGPLKWLEVSAGGVYGLDKSSHEKTQFSYAVPLVQAKVLFREYKPGEAPGAGLVIGSFLPYGKGAFKAPASGLFSYLTVSQCFFEGEKLLLHGNIGASYLDHNIDENIQITWGGGTQVKLFKGLHTVAELFSGDPYVPGTGTAYQTGFRYFVDDLIQVDLTVGEGMAGDNPLPFWVTAGLRVVTTSFKRKVSG